LEWNSIGLSERGMESLSTALISNKSITKVDLRNNRIGSNSAVYLNDIIRHNATIEILDLRWNEIGNEGAKQLISALQSNNTVKQLELAGNNINEDTLLLMMDCLNRNKGLIGPKTDRTEKDVIKQMFSPLKTAPNFYPRAEQDDELENIRKFDIKARFDKELIEHERSERKLDEIEHQLNQEREKSSGIREELLKAVENEKEVFLII
jgi:hypothetical protein